MGLLAVAAKRCKAAGIAQESCLTTAEPSIRAVVVNVLTEKLHRSAVTV